MKTRATIAVMWVVLILAGLAIERQHYAQFQAAGETAQRDRGDILLDVFGEFRTVLARYLWFKMDLFHEAIESEGAPDKEAEILPLLRMISLLDPSMTDAYDNIAWDLSQTHQQHKQALEILDEGLRRNPQSFQLHFRGATICYKDKQYQAAVDRAKRSVELAQEEFDVLNSNRILFGSAREAGDREAMVQALDVLIKMRPTERHWQDERASCK
jgi:tetratricopeptide (TPR) repeat protein